MQLRLSEIAAATGGTLVGEDIVIDGVSIDSRTVGAGELFVPIVAERDGHNFIPLALKAGAVAFMAERPPAEHAPHVLVADTAAALASMAASARERLPDLVVGITGSVGKTSTKDLVAATLGAARRTHASYRSFNNELGVPLTLLNAPDEVEALVVEMGARGAGHIRELCGYVRPTVGVVTRIGAAHTELFGSVDAVAAGKAELVEALPSSGTAVLNAADDRVAAMARLTSADVITFGHEPADGLESAHVHAADVRLDAELRPTFVARTPWGDQEVILSVAGHANVENALAAVAVAGVAGLSLATIAKGLAATELSPWRMAVSRTANGALLINDAYNANPLSVDAALRSLASVDARRRVAVLGVMAELGVEHDSAHRAMRELAASFDIEVIAFRETGYGAPVVDTHDDVLRRLGELCADDAILVKGSRVAGLEELAAKI